MSAPDDASPAAAPDPDPLAQLRNEFFRRMGRNVWLFQRAEFLLKHLVLASGFAARPAEFVGRLERRKKDIAAKTFGTLADELFKGLASDSSPSDELEDPEEMSFWLRLRLDARQAEVLRKDLAARVKERNELVHHAFVRWKLDSGDELQAALLELDAQRERILSFHARLLPLCKGLISAVDYLGSQEFRQLFRAGHLQGLLVDSVQRAARADGWTPVASAGHRFAEHRNRLSEDTRAALPKFQRLLQESGLFELCEEPTKSGSRLLCRLRPQDAAGGAAHGDTSSSATQGGPTCR
jgi:hypothetical protein